MKLEACEKWPTKSSIKAAFGVARCGVTLPRPIFAASICHHPIVGGWQRGNDGVHLLNALLCGVLHLVNLVDIANVRKNYRGDKSVNRVELFFKKWRENEQPLHQRSRLIGVWRMTNNLLC